jgi:two-component system sensor histidine kinase VicK
MIYPDIPSETRKEFLSMAVSESDRMTRIVKDLLVLSRLDNNRMRWQVSEFAVDEFLRHVCDVMKTEADLHKHTLLFLGDSDSGNITADKERIEQVIINIISNAIKYTDDGGRILVSVKPNDESIKITVKDNGIGIPKEDVEHLFERFYRVEKSRTTDSGGTGLGLAIAREIVDAHGGKIKIKSKVGSGSEVSVELPRKAALEV